MSMAVKQLPWQASWIWGGDSVSPRNEWRWFRHTFICPEELANDAEIMLWITADSRYEVYINGNKIGRGPVRNFPSDLFYDSYSVGHLLRRGEANTIAVQVMHFGISNFYYLRGRGGLLAQLDVVAGDKEVALASTDAGWLTTLHNGQDPAVGRMSCQQAFAERIDARSWHEDWATVNYSDRSWPKAYVIGEAGMEPWIRLQPRDIPYLTEETVLPVSVLSLNRVVPYRLTAFVDNYALMKPPGEENANSLCYAGAFGTVLRLPEATEVNVAMIVSGFNIGTEVQGLLRLGDSLLTADEMEHEPPLLKLRAKLPAGDHLLLFTAFGPDHGSMLRLAVDADKEIQWFNPLSEDSEEAGKESPFAALGPTYSFTIVDYENQEEQFAEWKRHASRLTKTVASIRSVEELRSLDAMAISIPHLLANGEDAFMPQVAKRLSEAYAVPTSLQQTAVSSADPGIVPIFPDGDTEFILDFGKEWSGYLQFELEADEGVVIDWYGIEYLKGDYVQHTFGLDNTLRYIAKQGFQRYVSPVRRGFRYLIVTVRGAARPVRIHGVKVIQSNYPTPEIGAFQSSDARLDAIWQIARHTTKLCMEDTFVDCPAYEQTFWVGDSRNEALVHNYLFGGTDIVKRCLRLVPGSSFQTPLYVDQVPSGWRSVIPNWTFFWVAACVEYAEHTGDEVFAAEMLPKMAYTLDHYLQRVNGDGLLEIKGWNLLDWAPIDQPDDGVVTHQNMMLAHALRRTADMARKVSGAGSEPATRYEAAASALDEAINRHLWSEERGAFLDCIHNDGRRSDIFSMQTQVIALNTDVAAGERKKKLRAYLTSTPEGFVPIGSPFMSFFYYEALMRTGNVRHMLDDIRHNYGFMIDSGATTCWEMYGHTTMNRANENDLTRSHCHAWSAAPGYFLGAFVLGIRPAAPGWKKVTVAPEPGDLAWARGAVPLPGDGKLEVEWTAENGVLATLRVTAPADVELDIQAPAACSVTVRRVNVLAG